VATTGGPTPAAPVGAATAPPAAKAEFTAIPTIAAAVKREGLILANI